MQELSISVLKQEQGNSITQLHKEQLYGGIYEEFLRAAVGGQIGSCLDQVSSWVMGSSSSSGNNSRSRMSPLLQDVLFSQKLHE